MNRKDLDGAVTRAKEHESFCNRNHRIHVKEICKIPGCVDGRIFLKTVEHFETALVALKGGNVYTRKVFNQIGIETKKDEW